MSGWLEFNIHDRVAVRVERRAPTAPLLETMFEPFLASDLGRSDLTIGGTVEPSTDAAYGLDGQYRYTPTMLHLERSGVQVIREGDRFCLNGRRELLVAALPLIDRIAVRRDAAMVHAASIAFRGHGVCLPAWGGTGKTSTIAKLLRLDGVAFMGDDWAFLSREGTLLGYHKPMFVKPHHRPIYPHLFRTNRKPLIPSALSGVLASISTAVHPAITRYPRVASMTRKWSPEHLIVRPREAFPDAAFADTAELAVTVFLERHEGTSPTLQEQDADWLRSRLIGNFQCELPRQSQELIVAMGATGLMPLDRGMAEKAAVLDGALAGKPIFLLQVPQALAPDQASDLFVEHLQEVFARCGLS